MLRTWAGQQALRHHYSALRGKHPAAQYDTPEKKRARRAAKNARREANRQEWWIIHHGCLPPKK